MSVEIVSDQPDTKVCPVDMMFPFGFPWPTAMYLTLYVATLTLHMLLMHYVLAGSAWVAWESIASAFSTKPRAPSAITKLLQDWLPFALGGAITAGVAPLLFVQILYQREFYTANLLLFHRWMSILPVLIVAFYLLYLQKSVWLQQRFSSLQPIVWLIIVSCFAFVGYSWTENHLLSLQQQQVWTSFYVEREIFFARIELLPRLLIWFAGAFSTLCTILAWQLHFQRTATRVDAAPTVTPISAEIRNLARAGAVSILLTVVASGTYGLMLGKEVGQVVWGGLAGPYLAAVIVGWMVQFWMWGNLGRVGLTTGRSLSILTVTVVATAAAMNVLREAVRLAQVDVAGLMIRHAEAANIGGIVVFLFFLVVNSGVVVWLLRSVAKSNFGKV
jgi:hypothetical protein